MENEKRLIDANALKQRFDEREADDIELYGCHIIEGFQADDAKEIVDKMPTVDAVEVVYGRWKYYHKQNIAVCTNCSFERKLDADFGKAVSCPNCGAKMDGDGNVV